MWTYTTQDNKQLKIDYSNINNVVLSKGITDHDHKYRGKYYHEEIDDYYEDKEYIAVIYLKTSNSPILVFDEDAFEVYNQLCSLSK